MSWYVVLHMLHLSCHGILTGLLMGSREAKHMRDMPLHVLSWTSLALLVYAQLMIPDILVEE